ncbi:hypothetical protein HMN09_01150600 [Mycena chlorophos]|uniref:Uncharacterized protein n=1 Tax=Mycena chlorophos TaxID=658473 RepID=A0A8H6S9F8_MYCCL|nr:hypothetical protein HMN09_01150600 [Mycena chlorophos]
MQRISFSSPPFDMSSTTSTGLSEFINGRRRPRCRRCRHFMKGHNRALCDALVGAGPPAPVQVPVAPTAASVTAVATTLPVNTVVHAVAPSPYVQPASAPPAIHIIVLHMPPTTATGTTAKPTNYSSAANGSVAGGSEHEDEEDRDDDSYHESNMGKQVKGRSSASTAATVLGYIAQGAVLLSAIGFWLQSRV